MHFFRTLLSASAAQLSLVYASPLILDISLKTTEESIIPKSSADTTVVTDHTAVEPVTIQSVRPNLHEVSPPKYTNTAEVIFWNDKEYTGTKKRYQVLEDKCYNLPTHLVNYVISAKLEPKIWYCIFFPERACEAETGSDEVHQLSAGEYDFLFPEGMDYVSFSCKLYERGPESRPEVMSGISTFKGHHASSPQTVMSIPEGNPSVAGTPLDSSQPDLSADPEVKTIVPSVELYRLPGFSGPVSVIPYYPGTWGCVPLKTPEETGFQSILMSPEFRSCKFFAEPACGGTVLLEIRKTTPLVQGTRWLHIKTMYCSFES